MRLTWHRQRIVPTHRFATAQGGISEKETIVVSFEHDGRVGLGECVPSQLYGQTLESSDDALRGMAAELGDDPFAIEMILSRLLARFDGQRAAIAAVEAALLDWIGRSLKTPVWRWLGLPRARVETTFTIGIGSAAETTQKLSEAIAIGYRALKVKVGTENDDDTLRRIRERFDGPLLLDANEAWTVEEATERIRRLAAYRPALIEQPLRKDDWPHLGALRGLIDAPIFADESCERLADIVKLRGLVDGVNVKLTKCGGAREAMRMNALARALGMKTMIGCFVSSSLAIAPALAIAPLFDFADLDGHLLLGANDPFRGIDSAGATLTLADQPGLGIVAR